MDLGRVGAIIPGGGLKCAFQVGFFEAIDEVGIKLEKVQGVSGGALNSAKYVEGGSRELKAVWLTVERNGSSWVFSNAEKWKHLAFGGPALYGEEGLWRLLGTIDLLKIMNSPIHLEIVVFNELTEKLEVIRNHEYNPANLEHKDLLRRFIKASASYPGFFLPEEINGQIYSDGCGIVSESLADLDTVFLVESSQPRITVNPAKLPWKERILRKISSLIDEGYKEDIRASLSKFQLFPDDEEDKEWPVWRKLKEFLKGGPVSKRLILIQPSMNIDTLRINSCEKGDISKSMKHGYESTKGMLARLATI